MEKNKRRFITSVYIQDLFAIPLAKFCIQIGISANLVTLLGLFLSIYSGYLFFYSNFVLGSIFFGIALIIDSTDGRVARGTNSFSKFGALLDSVTDKFRSIFVALFLLIGIGFSGKELIMYYFLYLLLPCIRFALNLLLKFKDDPTIIFWDSTPMENWFKEKNIVGLYTGWERSVMCLFIAPLTSFTIELFVLSICLEIILYFLGLIIYFRKRNLFKI
tara:strand:- start:2652 stop:3305 length:654 start_codon:yes stop_codon:yes gene_type:complete